MGIAGLGWGVEATGRMNDHASNSCCLVFLRSALIHPYCPDALRSQERILQMVPHPQPVSLHL